ncbi:type IX secretion system PorP/SprF family membrane protein [Winogradskyella epiphytica]|uniref:Type IX secretion system PorP/SprF family membrane protein n=1 Tax=Winogradskyella epiphytica TaxID=262005 RepID=A0A2V4XFF6_9FLAO|nr:PorP/SprF family type IX secretion system membrane protein [Winogradskyella epiphytica]PYE81614.1 type IX secretion system PorP/SprF family membrane protein [Winogradskyella epiphytica]
MKAHLLVLILFTCSYQALYSQDTDGVVALDLPTRNSLTFNSYTINPTFSFVRSQSKFISIYNKREWVQFENAPLTYLASYSGRFGENIGAGVGLFQQNYGVLTTFGGILNFAYNARLGRDSNLTFGLNIGAYKSGVNTSNVVTNFEDPALQNVPENFLLTVNPGINYGTEFLDFGLSINNLALYNFESSELIQDNPKQSVQAHIMYTGYMDSRGFFDESKFSGLIRSEFQQDETIISGVAMLTVPKGIWGQVGYNTLYGASAGLGLNITTQIAIEYNFEKALGDLSNFGPSHEITLAYRFKNNNYYDYSREDEVSGILSTNGYKRRRVNKSKVASSKSSNKTKAKKETETQAKIIAEQKAKEDAEAQAKLLAEQKAQEEAEARAKLLAEQKAQEEAEAQAKFLAEQKAQEEAEAQAKLLAEQKAQEEAEAQAKLLAEQKAQEEAEARAKLLAEQKAKEEAEARAKLLAEQKAKEEAEAQAKLLAEQKAQEEAEAQAKLLAEQKAKEEAEAQAKVLAEQKAKEEAEAQAKLLAEQNAKEEAEAQEKQNFINAPTDELAKTMQVLAQSTEESKTVQNELLEQFNEIVEIKDQDLKDLKEENDLSDQGITVKPKPFKSVTAENNTLRAIRSDLDNVIKARSEKINQLSNIYNKRAADNAYSSTDEVMLYYDKEIKRLKAEQLKAAQLRSQLDAQLTAIQEATEYEKRRRIKRAAFDNDEVQYKQDRTFLKNVKLTTPLSSTPLTEEDFDFGEDQGNNIQILKNIKNIESGYYLIIAVHSDIKRRNEFVTNVVASGQSEVDFFHDVNTSKYYIYYEKFEDIGSANNALKAKGNKPYNGKMSIVKIEN